MESVAIEREGKVCTHVPNEHLKVPHHNILVPPHLFLVTPHFFHPKCHVIYSCCAMVQGSLYAPRWWWRWGLSLVLCWCWCLFLIIFDLQVIEPFKVIIGLSRLLPQSGCTTGLPLFVLPQVQLVVDRVIIHNFEGKGCNDLPFFTNN